MLALVPMVASAHSCRESAASPLAVPLPLRTERTHAHVITSEAIERSGATDAWEVHEETQYDRDERMRRTTASRSGSIQSADTAASICATIRWCTSTAFHLSDIRALRQLGAKDIDNIEEMGSVEATAYFGTNSNAGVILIHSRARPAD